MNYCPKGLLTISRESDDFKFLTENLCDSLDNPKPKRSQPLEADKDCNIQHKNKKVDSPVRKVRTTSLVFSSHHAR